MAKKKNPSARVRLRAQWDKMHAATAASIKPERGRRQRKG
jgi:hypothetical protein